MKQDVLSLTKAELEQSLKPLNLPRYRTKQIFEWLHVKHAQSFEEMTDLPKTLREDMGEIFDILSPSIETKLVSRIDGTVKYLYRLKDFQTIETVVMKYKYGYSCCVSSEVGCSMGCRFCASTIGGIKRKLYASEILGQIYAAEKDLGIRISHCVLMGIGEPLDNYDNVIKFIRILSSPDAHDMSPRNISVSTCGIVPGIDRLSDESLPITLSISLHAPFDNLRSSLMPINDRWNISEIIEACRRYQKKNSRRISFEYSMIRGVNDSPECARELTVILKGLLCHVNLIPINEVEGTPFKPSDDASIKAFTQIIESRNIPITVRRRLGSDINASCGQLRRNRS